jgi:hypothetical protein
MEPIGWTADKLRGRCETCGSDVAISWQAYFAGIERGWPVVCPACEAEQPMRDRRQEQVPVAVDRRA